MKSTTFSEYQYDLLNSSEEVIVCTVGRAIGTTYAIREYLNFLTRDDFLIILGTERVLRYTYKGFVKVNPDFKLKATTHLDLNDLHGNSGNKLVVIIDNNTSAFERYAEQLKEVINYSNRTFKKIKIFIVDDSVTLNRKDSLLGRMGWLDYPEDLKNHFSINDLVYGRVDLDGLAKGVISYCPATNLRIKHFKNINVATNPWLLKDNPEFLTALFDLNPEQQNRLAKGTWVMKDLTK